jgi:hypothetical protein
MTPGIADRPLMPIEDFEELADVAPHHVRLEYVDGRVRTKDPLSVEDFEELERRAPETVRLEYINGKLEVKAMPDGNHREIFVWLQEQCMQHRPDLRVYGVRRPDRGLPEGAGPHRRRRRAQGPLQGPR